MSDHINTKMTITLIPPGLYDSRDPEWQEICKKFYVELNAELKLENNDIRLEPERVKYQKSAELIEFYDKLLLPFGGITALGTALKYLFDKLIDLQKQRIELERAKKIKINIGDKSFDFEAEGFNEKEADKLIEKIISLKTADGLPEKTSGK